MLSNLFNIENSSFRRLSIFLSILCKFIYLSPLIILREDSVIEIHDNLDSVISDIKVLIDSGKAFSSSATPIEAAMNGLDRGSFPPETYFLFWLFYFLGIFNGYLINLIIIHFVAFFGMYIFLNRYVILSQNDHWISIFVSLLFALLPFYPVFGLAIAGMPLLLYSFLNIRNSLFSFKDWLIILLMPFYSFFPSVLSMLPIHSFPAY